MEYLFLFAGPGVAICLYFFYKDIYNKEPRLNLLVSFLLGAAAIYPAILLEQNFGGKVIDGSVNGVALLAYVIVAFSEEGSKFLGFRLYSYNQKSFDEPFDGIIYAVMVSMGFATAENIKYLIESDPGSELKLGLLRMITAVPAHATFAIVMGYFAGKAKFDPKNRTALLITGLICAIAFHGTYDFFLFLPRYSFVGMEAANQYLAYGGFVSFIVSIVLCRKLIRRHRNLSREMFKPTNTTTSA
jgi:RsiW-degrading membrane proteinase PrsW (M82 family)